MSSGERLRRCGDGERGSEGGPSTPTLGSENGTGNSNREWEKSRRPVRSPGRAAPVGPAAPAHHPQVRPLGVPLLGAAPARYRAFTPSPPGASLPGAARSPRIPSLPPPRFPALRCRCRCRLPPGAGGRSGAGRGRRDAISAKSGPGLNAGRPQKRNHRRWQRTVPGGNCVESGAGPGTPGVMRGEVRCAGCRGASGPGGNWVHWVLQGTGLPGMQHGPGRSVGAARPGVAVGCCGVLNGTGSSGLTHGAQLTQSFWLAASIAGIGRRGLEG